MAIVSLLITSYNRSPYLPRAIESVLSQTYPHFELLIWDDGSTDTSLDIAQHYASLDERIRVIAAPHQGIAPSLKAAIAHTTDPYLGWVDSDDRLAPTALEETIAILEAQSAIGLVYTDHQIIDEQDNILGMGSRCQIPYSKERLLVDFMTFHFRLMRRSVYEQVGGINPFFASAEDYDLCLRLSEVTEFHHVAQPLYFYRRHSSNVTNNQPHMMRWATIAIEQAIVRRGLADRYQLDVDLVSYFKLVLRRSDPTASPAQPAVPLVSIVIPCYNAAPRIEACLQSCLQQTYPHLEILIVDNNSTDGSSEIIQHYAQTVSNLRVVNCPQQGANFARNAGFAQAQGNYIQWLDADDEIAPTKIALQVAALETHPDYDLAYGDWEWCFYDNQKLIAQFAFPNQQYKDMLLQLLIDNWSPPHTYLLRRSAAEKLHQMQAWNPQTPICMDREYLTLAALLGCKFLYVPNAIVRYYRWSPTQVTQQTSHQKRVQSRKTMFQRFQSAALARSPDSLQPIHWALLRQSWELWQPALVLKQDADSFWLSHPQRQDAVEIDRQTANVVRTLLQSPGTATLEDKARQIIQQLWMRILVCISQSSQPEQIGNFALLSQELSRLLGMIAVEASADEEGLWQLDLERTIVQTKLSPWLLDIPLFSPLFGEQRLVVFMILEQLRQQGWLEPVTPVVAESLSLTGTRA